MVVTPTLFHSLCVQYDIRDNLEELFSDECSCFFFHLTHVRASKVDSMSTDVQ